MLLRTLVLVLAFGAPSLALAQAHPQQRDESAVGIDVVGDDGAVVGHVASVQRDRHGRIVAAEIPGQEPINAPYASSALVADNESNALMTIVRDREAHPERMASLTSSQQEHAR
jgi:hypothetical protein